MKFNNSVPINSIKNKYYIPKKDLFHSENKKLLSNEFFKEQNLKNLKFDNPAQHIQKKYFDKDYKYYKKDLTVKERNIGYKNELDFLKYGKLLNYSPSNINLSEKIYRKDKLDIHENNIKDRAQADNIINDILNSNNIKTDKNKEYKINFDLQKNKISFNNKINDNLSKNNFLQNHMLNSYKLSSKLNDKEKNILKKIEYINSYDKIKEEDKEDIKKIFFEDMSKEEKKDKINTFTNKLKENYNISEENIKKISKELEETEKIDNLILEFSWKNNNLLDINQMYSYGKGQTNWIDDYTKLEKMSFRLSKEGAFRYDTNPYTNKDDYLAPEIKFINKTKNEFEKFLFKNGYKLNNNDNINVMYNSKDKMFNINGIQDLTETQRLNVLINSDKNMTSLLRTLANSNLLNNFSL